MDNNHIRKYAELMQDLDLTGLEISENGKTVRLERAAPVVTATPVTGAAPSPPPTPPAEDTDIISITSPMVGVFYASPAENQPPFVSVGDSVRKGEVLCIIESMKLLNEIPAAFDGTVTEICVSNQQVVDYGHVLLRIRKETP